jgi:RHS repeat-associated protein
LYYISGGDGLAAVYVKNAGQDDKIYYPFTDHLGSIVKLADGNGTEVFKASYDAWGNQTVTNNTFKFHRGYTGHEHLPEFNLINMNGRMYDPVLGRFLSPDPFVQAPDFSQSFNRYSYCLNNPMRYTDPSGEVWWLIPVIVAAVFATGNTATHAMRGDINNFGDGLKYFGQGAVTGFALGCAWQFAPLITWQGVGQGIQTAMTWYAYGQAGLGGAGMVGGAINDGWNGAGRAGKAFLGNFYMDENNWLGGIAQGFLRHTWEMPQSLIGQGYTQIRNIGGNVDRVDYFGGATFATNENSENHNGITFGNYINMNIREQITGDFDTYATTMDPMYMHEYGHTIDSRAFGLSYLFAIGIPSGISAWKDQINHTDYWTEKRANRRAAKYFGKHYRVNWSGRDFDRYPLN